eukprot:898925-Amphidinium_carterae.1
MARSVLKRRAMVSHLQMCSLRIMWKCKRGGHMTLLRVTQQWLQMSAMAGIVQKLLNPNCMRSA